MSHFPPWSDLPSELLLHIYHLLTPNTLDLLRFTSVCKSWHSSTILSPPSPTFPLTIPFPSAFRNGYYSTFETDNLTVTLTSIYALHPPNAQQIEGSSESESLRESKIWVSFVDHLCPGKVSLREPFTRRDYDMPLDFPRNLNLLDFHVSEVGHYFNVSNVYVDENGRVVKKKRWKKRWSWYVDKVVVLSNGLGIVILYHDGKLGLLRLDGKVGDSNEWLDIHDGKGFHFDDVVDFKGRILGIDRRARVYEVDYYSSHINVIGPSISGGGGKRKRLVESLGKLYLVVSCNIGGVKEETKRFKVYVQNEEKRKWVEVTSIGDRVFMFGRDFSISAPVVVFDGLFGKNQIIFHDYSFNKYNDCDYEHYLSSGTRFITLRASVFSLEDVTQVFDIQSCAGYCTTFWPPPTWLWMNNKLRLHGTFQAAVDKLIDRVNDVTLKASFKELSPSVKAFISFDGFSRESMLNILKELEMIIKFLNDLIEEIDREVRIIGRNIVEGAKIRQGNSNSRIEPNQVLDVTLQKATPHHNHMDEWMSSEVSRRMTAHIKLKSLLLAMVETIEGVT